jgi:hypothetical protein
VNHIKDVRLAAAARPSDEPGNRRQMAQGAQDPVGLFDHSPFCCFVDQQIVNGESPTVPVDPLMATSSRGGGVVEVLRLDDRLKPGRSMACRPWSTRRM